MNKFLVEDDVEELSLYEYSLNERHWNIEVSRFEDAKRFVDFLDTLDLNQLPSMNLLMPFYERE